MKTNLNFKYKDDIPINTINRIKRILYNHNFVPKESMFKNSVNGFYSLRVTINNTAIGTNGKGTTSEYATASAYAELMERLQNQSMFRLSLDVSPEALMYKGFYYSPDERRESIEEFLNDPNEWREIQENSLTNNEKLSDLLNKWKGVSYEKIDCDFITIPYINLMTNNISNIPMKMVSKMYMSNGMCAGNTTEEALVQGLSEVLERYVNIKLIRDKMCPPTIPVDELEKYPNIYKMIKDLEIKGNYKIIMKDCSLSQGFPVIGAIFINKDTQSYFVKFGAHPVIEIAMERTLTELLQGQDVNNMMGVKEYSCFPQMRSVDSNIMQILVDGSGYYPNEFFSENFSYNFEPFKKIEATTNRQLLMYLINLLSSLKLNVFVRDFSYLGFPTYQVIVPGFSEIEKINDINSIEDYSDYVKIKHFMRRIGSLKDVEISEMLVLMERLNIKGQNEITQFLSLSNKGDLPWYYASIDLFKALAYYKIKDFDQSYRNFDRYLKNIKLTPNNLTFYGYYKCVRDYIGLKTNYKNNENIKCILNQFYDNEIVDDVIKNYIDTDNVYEIYGGINCWECKSCIYKTYCNNEKVENIYKKLKSINYDNFINQYNVTRQLELY